MQVLETFQSGAWHGPFSGEEQERALEALERGRILYFPRLAFFFREAETPFLSPAWSDGRSKNISFEPQRGTLQGATVTDPDILRTFQAMMARYAAAARCLLELLLPSYSAFLDQARTSFRPLDIAHRETSYRKDDQRLHTMHFPPARPEALASSASSPTSTRWGLTASGASENPSNPTRGSSSPPSPGPCPARLGFWPGCGLPRAGAARMTM